MKFTYLILILSAFYTCGNEPIDTYILTNKTKYNLEIYAFSHRESAGNPIILEAETIFLSAFSKATIERPGGEGGSSYTYFSEGRIDSVRIVFNNEKLLILEYNASDTHSHHSIFQAFEASITQEDYEEAILIE